MPVTRMRSGDGEVVENRARTSNAGFNNFDILRLRAMQNPERAENQADVESGQQPQQ